MAMSKAQRQKATNEMISIINSRAEAARRFREEVKAKCGGNM